MNTVEPLDSDPRRPISRREFVEAVAIASVGLAALSIPIRGQAVTLQLHGVEDGSNDKQTEDNAMGEDNSDDPTK